MQKINDQILKQNQQTRQ